MAQAGHNCLFDAGAGEFRATTTTTTVGNYMATGHDGANLTMVRGARSCAFVCSCTFIAVKICKCSGAGARDLSGTVSPGGVSNNNDAVVCVVPKAVSVVSFVRNVGVSV